MSLMNDIEKNCVMISELLQFRHPKLFMQLEQLLIENTISFGTLENTNDIWVMDFMPFQLSGNKFIYYSYNPDYLKLPKYNHLKSNAKLVCNTNIKICDYTICPLVIDGGNIVHFDNKIICTSKIFSENSHLSYSQVLSLMEYYFESEIIVIPIAPGDWLGHADGVVRLIKNDTVLINCIGNKNINEKKYFDVLTNIFSQNGLHWEILIKGNNEKFKGAEGLYLNYLEVGNIIIVPEYGIPEDEIALHELSIFFPNKIILSLKSNTLAKNNGVLRCVSWVINRELQEVVLKNSLGLKPIL